MWAKGRSTWDPALSGVKRQEQSVLKPGQMHRRDVILTLLAAKSPAVQLTLSLPAWDGGGGKPTEAEPLC